MTELFSCTQCKNNKKGKCTTFKTTIGSEYLLYQKERHEERGLPCFTAKKKSKYSNKRIKYANYSFDSVKEYKRFLLLQDRLLKWEITALKVHPRYLLQGSFVKNGVKYKEIVYEADFEYLENGCMVVEDVKSKATKTPVYLLKKKLFERKFNSLTIKEID